MITIAIKEEVNTTTELVNILRIMALSIESGNFAFTCDLGWEVTGAETLDGISN